MDDQILTPWPCRRWTFTGPAELHPAVLERLRGLGPRAEALAAAVDPAILTRTPADGWSVQRHLAHLADLEQLLHHRLDAYEAGASVLPAADMSNLRTVDADHDARSIDDVLASVRRERARSLTRLDAYPRDFFGRSAFHERLGVQKRVVDTCSFFADHDDHHLVLARLVARRVAG